MRWGYQSKQEWKWEASECRLWCKWQTPYTLLPFVPHTQTSLLSLRPAMTRVIKTGVWQCWKGNSHVNKSSSHQNTSFHCLWDTPTPFAVKRKWLCLQKALARVWCWRRKKITHFCSIEHNPWPGSHEKRVFSQESDLQSLTEYFWTTLIASYTRRDGQLLPTHSTSETACQCQHSA